MNLSTSREGQEYACGAFRPDAFVTNLHQCKTTKLFRFFRRIFPLHANGRSDLLFLSITRRRLTQSSRGASFTVDARRYACRRCIFLRANGRLPLALPPSLPSIFILSLNPICACNSGVICKA
jgi:hypothetical protein